MQCCDTFVSVLCKGNGSLDPLGLILKCYIVPMDVISGIFMISLVQNFHAQLKVLVAVCNRIAGKGFVLTYFSAVSYFINQVISMCLITHQIIKCRTRGISSTDRSEFPTSAMFELVMLAN